MVVLRLRHLLFDRIREQRDEEALEQVLLQVDLYMLEERVLRVGGEGRLHEARGVDLGDACAEEGKDGDAAKAESGGVPLVA